MDSIDNTNMNNKKINKRTPKNKNINKPVQKRRFWQDGFSINESRMSALIIILFSLIVFVLVMMILNVPIPDVPVGLKDIITTLIWAICGVNVFNKVSNFFSPNNSIGNYNGYNGYSGYNNYGTNYGITYDTNNYSDGDIADISISANTNNSTSNLGRDGV